MAPCGWAARARPTRGCGLAARCERRSVHLSCSAVSSSPPFTYSRMRYTRLPAGLRWDTTSPRHATENQGVGEASRCPLEGWLCVRDEVLVQLRHGLVIQAPEAVYFAADAFDDSVKVGPCSLRWHRVLRKIR